MRRTTLPLLTILFVLASVIGVFVWRSGSGTADGASALRAEPAAEPDIAEESATRHARSDGEEATNTGRAGATEETLEAALHASQVLVPVRGARSARLVRRALARTPIDDADQRAGGTALRSLWKKCLEAGNDASSASPRRRNRR